MNYFYIFIFIPIIILGQTNEQISKAKKIISKTGMSEQQVRSLAKANGFTEMEIEAAIEKEGLKQSENRLSNTDDKLVGDSPQNQSSINDTKQDTKKEELNDFKDDISINLEKRNSKVGYFGYDIFKKDPALFQSALVGTVDPSYLIGPGDEIIIMLWGETQFRQVLKVDKEGFVFIPEIGQVSVNGLNLNLLESKLFRVFSQSYASLNPQNREPTTFLDVSLGNLRPLRIQVIGEVSQPGAYTVSPSATLFSSLYYFNGPTYQGSLRDIQLIRDGEKIASIDFYDYLLTGKKLKDQKLQLDDVIYIPRRLKTVSIEGEINQNGVFELKPNESFLDLINLAGGLKITAFLDRTQIDRIIPFKKRLENGIERLILDFNLNDILESKKTIQMEDGDQVRIFSILDSRNNVISISGSVKRPGTYDLGDSLNLLQLIDKAGGASGDAVLGKIDVLRINSDLTESLIELDISSDEIFEKKLYDLNLKEGDNVIVYGMKNLQTPEKVILSGNVKVPGIKTLKKNMTVYDLIFQDGGLIDKEFKRNIYLNRADLIRWDKNMVTKTIFPLNIEVVLNDRNSSENLKLISGDELIIYSKNIFNLARSVKITGVINKPGTYTLKTGMNIKDLIIESGGVNEDVYRYKVEISRINPYVEEEGDFAEIISLDMMNDYSIAHSKLKNQKILDSNKNFLLKPYDLVTIRPSPYFSLQKQVEIKGEVFYPGSYTILHADESIKDIIKRAGGVKPSAFLFASSFIRDSLQINFDLSEILKSQKSKLNFNLRANDKIIIRKKSHMVRVIGEINSPGYYQFIPNSRISDLIRMAGGLSPNAEKKDIFISYPDGMSRKYKRWLGNSKVHDGSVITVGLAAEKEPFDSTEFMKEATSIFANLAQAIAIIFLAVK
jgi:polysaccharide biosynthesis/export protein